jgi:methyl-accepting chemotaxis protein
MNGLTSLKLRTRFLLLALFLTLIVTIESGVIIVQSVSITDQSSKFAENNLPILNKAHNLKLSVVQVQQWLTDISATRGRDGLNDGFAEVEKNSEVFRKLVTELTVLDSRHAERYQAMLPVFDAYYDVGKEMAQAYIDEGPAGGNRMMAQFDDVAAKMAEKVDSFLAGTEKDTAAAISTQQELAASARRSVIFGSLSILAGIGFLYFVMSRALTYLPRVLEELKRVAKGDLTATFEVDRRDELGALMQGVQSMRKELLEMISQINATTDQLAAEANNVSVVTTQTSANIQQQRSEMEQIAAAMNEMSATVREVAMNVGNTSTAAARANAETGKGKHVVEEAVHGIQQLAGQIERAADVITEVVQSSDNIDAVLDVIRGIAEQTNLLALNAAIEAARAGEQGRGFAVVADEVRTLAGRTQVSTAEIREIIEKLQSDSGNAAQVMNQSREQAKSVVDQALAAGSSLTTITASVSQIDDMSAQIATAAEEQNAVAEDMNRNIVRINDMATQNASAAEQTSQAGQNLARMASQLEGLVRRFRV